jgi:hypothetical protein
MLIFQADPLPARGRIGRKAQAPLLVLSAFGRAVSDTDRHDMLVISRILEAPARPSCLASVRRLDDSRTRYMSPGGGKLRWN